MLIQVPVTLSERKISELYQQNINPIFGRTIKLNLKATLSKDQVLNHSPHKKLWSNTIYLSAFLTYRMFPPDERFNMLNLFPGSWR
jgi:hypothetical protein